MKNNLRTIRRDRGLPMLGLAVQAGVSTATLSQIELWEYTPGPDVQERVANALGVPVSAIWPPSIEHEPAGGEETPDQEG